MFVVNGERLIGLPGKMRRTRRGGEQLLPEGRGIIPSTRTATQQRQSSGGVASHQRGPGGECELVGLLRPQREPAPRIQSSQRQRLASIASGCGTTSHQIEEPRRQPGQRQQIEPVVPEDLSQRSSVTRVNEFEIPGRNVRAWNITGASGPQHLGLQDRQRTARPGAVSPEAASRVEHVQVRQPTEPPWESMK